MNNIIMVVTLLASGGLLWFGHHVEGDRFGATLAAAALFILTMGLLWEGCYAC